MLEDHTQSFSEFARSFEVYLISLSQEGARISEELELGSNLPFDVTSKLKESLARSVQQAQDLIATETQKVMTLLDNFVSDEVSERIAERRSKVSAVWGEGTTHGQTSVVVGFYAEVKNLLKDVLNQHLKDCSQRFDDFLVKEAQMAPRDAINEVRVLLEQAADNIRAVATEQVAEQKEIIEAEIAAIEIDLSVVLTLIKKLMPVQTNAPIGQDQALALCL